MYNYIYVCLIYNCAKRTSNELSTYMNGPYADTDIRDKHTALSSYKPNLIDQTQTNSFLMET